MTDTTLRLRRPVRPARSTLRTFQHPNAHLPALIHCHGRSQRVVIRRTSREGITVEHATGLRPQERVQVQLFSTRSLSAAVVWSVAGYCGVAFDTPLADDDPLLLSQY